MTGRERLVKFLKAMREELLRVREWNSHDIGLCSLAKKVYRDRFESSAKAGSKMWDTDTDMTWGYVISYLHRRYEIERPIGDFWWPIAVTSKDINEPWAEEGRKSRLAFLDQAIADLEAEIKERL